MIREVDLQDEFARGLVAAAESGRQSPPRVHYNPDGDCIEFVFSDESWYAERIDDLLTVYYGQESRAIVGSLFKGVRRFVRSFAQTVPGFVVEVEDGPVKLCHLFTAGMWRQGDPVQRLKYRKLRDESVRLDAEVEVPALLGSA